MNRLQRREVSDRATEQDAREHLILGQARHAGECDLRVHGTARHVHVDRDILDILGRDHGNDGVDRRAAGEAHSAIAQFEGPTREA